MTHMPRFNRRAFVVGAAAADWGLRAPLLGGAALALVAWVAAYCTRGRTAAAFGLAGGVAAEGEPRP